MDMLLHPQSLLTTGVSKQWCCLCAASSAVTGFAGAREMPNSLAQRMQRALMTWQHPSASMPAAAMPAVAASKQGAEFLEERRAQWRESLRSLFMAVQASVCHGFYFVTPQARLLQLPVCAEANCRPSGPYVSVTLWVQD